MKISFCGADQAELLAWHKSTGNPKTTFLVHGEQESMHSSLKN
ncbi:MAG: MBL fold metallo-hydrolase RNA specificity domain-containing protein [Gammaproteobacteria bacterium]